VVETDSVSPTRTDASIAAKHYVGLSKKLNVVQIRIISGVIFNEGLASSCALAAATPCRLQGSQSFSSSSYSCRECQFNFGSPEVKDAIVHVALPVLG
jgi:hypothetical protein